MSSIYLWNSQSLFYGPEEHHIEYEYDLNGDTYTLPSERSYGQA